MKLISSNESANSALFSGSLAESTKEGIPVQVTYNISIINNSSDKNSLSQMNNGKNFSPFHDLNNILEQIILKIYESFISSQTIITLTDAVKENQDNFKKQIITEASNQGITIDRITVKVLTTPEQKSKTHQEKIYSWLLNIFIILATISMIYFLYH